MRLLPTIGGTISIYKNDDNTCVITSSGSVGLLYGVYELLDMNAELAEALRRDDTQGFIEAAARAPGYQPLVNVAHDYAAEGLTTIDEVLKLAGQSRDELDEEVLEVLELEPEI